jgi:hypothetical protein
MAREASEEKSETDEAVPLLPRICAEAELVAIHRHGDVLAGLELAFQQERRQVVVDLSLNGPADRPRRTAARTRAAPADGLKSSLAG